MFRHTNMGRLGSGTQSINHCCLPNSALDIAVTDEKGFIKTTPTSQMWLGIVETEESLNQQLQIDTGFGAGIKINDEISLSFSTKVEFSRQVKFDKQSIYFMVKKQVHHDETLTGNPTLSADAAKLIANGDISTFYSYYGDRFINQITSGCEIIVIVQLEAESVANYQGTTVQEGINAKLMSQEINQSFGSANQTAKFKGITHTSYWVYVSGNKDGKSFVPNSSSFPDLLNSIYKLLQLDPDTAPEVPLSYRTLPYANVLVKSDVILTDHSSKSSSSSSSSNKPSFDNRLVVTKSRAHITQSLIQLQDDVRYLCGLHADVADMLKIADVYSKKYDVTWRKMMGQEEKYKGPEGKKALESITNNREGLRSLTQELVEIDGRIIEMHKTPLTLLRLESEIVTRSHNQRGMTLTDDREEKTALLDGSSAHTQPFDGTTIRVEASKTLQSLRTVLSKMIAQYPVIEGYKYLRTVTVPRKARSQEFSIQLHKSAKYLFWRAHTTTTQTTPQKETRAGKQTLPGDSGPFTVLVSPLASPVSNDIPLDTFQREMDEAQSIRFLIKKKSPDPELSCCARLFCCPRPSVQYQEVYGRSVLANGDYTEANNLSNNDELILEGVNNDTEMAVNIYEVAQNPAFKL